MCKREISQGFGTSMEIGEKNKKNLNCSKQSA